MAFRRFGLKGLRQRLLASRATHWLDPAQSTRFPSIYIHHRVTMIQRSEKKMGARLVLGGVAGMGILAGAVPWQCILMAKIVRRLC
jgi:hypothetical protein